MLSRSELLQRFGLVETDLRIVSEDQYFGRLRVLVLGQFPGTYKYMAICECKCGSGLKVIRQDHLAALKTLSCGCLRGERTKTHGLSKSPHYVRWRGMMERCYKVSCQSYPVYGGRGIKVCEAWHDIVTFITQLPLGYFEGAELDRIDNDGDYEPGNVRWVTSKANCNNRSTGHLLTYQGITKTMTEWAEEYGLVMQTLWERIEIWKWDVERALTTPAADRKENMLRAQSKRWEGHTKKAAPKPRVLKTYEYKGKIYTMAQLSELSGTHVDLLRKRINERGWTVERAVETNQ